MMINRAQSMASPEILHCLVSTPDSATVLKWQQDQLDMTQFSQNPQQQQQQQQQKYLSDFSMLSLVEQPPPQGYQGELLIGSGGTILNELEMTRPIKQDPGMDPCWTAATATTDEYGISMNIRCPPMAAGKESFRKRKADNKTLLHPSKKVEQGDESKAKKVKGCLEEEELAPNSNSGNNTKNGNKESKIKEGSDGSSSKDNPKASEVQKLDYIHVRARRGQATDSHSLAERVRREKISERMKYLQDLVPGCNKITGKAGMLDEIINYVQSLQRQVEFLSMKLATVNPSIDFDIEDLFAKEVFPACSSNIPSMGVSPEMANIAYLQYNSAQQMGPVCGSDLCMSEVEMGIRRTISAPVSIPEPFTDSSCLTQQMQNCLPWEQPDLQSMYNMEFQQARQQSFPSQTYAGPN